MACVDPRTSVMTTRHEGGAGWYELGAMTSANDTTSGNRAKKSSPGGLSGASGDTERSVSPQGSGYTRALRRQRCRGLRRLFEERHTAGREVVHRRHDENAAPGDEVGQARARASEFAR